MNGLHILYHIAAPMFTLHSGEKKRRPRILFDVVTVLVTARAEHLKSKSSHFCTSNTENMTLFSYIHITFKVVMRTVQKSCKFTNHDTQLCRFVIKPFVSSLHYILLRLGTAHLCNFPVFKY